MLRIGLGYDLHRLVENRPLVLGGVILPFHKGEDGHSDGDVLLHAIIDSLLGASCLGDIGSFFPDTDHKWKNADSKLLLKTAWQKVKADGWQIENIDCIIHLETPKFLPFRDEVRKSIAQILECTIDNIFVKAKTGEKLGDIGQSNAVACQAICLLSRY
ncbi:MAG: 2-C-methyl-D-erythritol 2,4-cyclodiphosphate synthase [Treponema sp.]|nr:2-C-methyl-D-erythritol 2,4-cyclodiphosphate synthase [Treponema sp.]